MKYDKKYQLVNQFIVENASTFFKVDCDNFEHI